jgi:hypothetical protein
MFVFLESKLNGKVVQAAAGGGGDLIARIDFAQGFESFLVEYPGSSHGPILRNGDNVFLKANKGQYWSAKNAGGSTMGALASVPQGWETFTILAQDSYFHDGDELTTLDAEGKPLMNADGSKKKIIVSIKTSGGQWVSAPTDALTGAPKPLVALASTGRYADEATFELVFTGGNVKRPAYDEWAGWTPTV